MAKYIGLFFNLDRFCSGNISQKLKNNTINALMIILGKVKNGGI